MLSRIRDNPQHVFDCFCEVVIPTKADEKPWIVQKFPDSYQNEETLKMVPQFTFPCDFERTTVQHFSFVLTSIDSKWTFGFCRHAPQKQTALVLLSAFPWHDTFFKLLNCLSDLTASDDQGQLWTCLQALHRSPVPDRGGPVVVPLPEGKSFSVASTDHLSLPCIPQDRNLTEYFNAVDTNNMMIMFASMLYERRIVVTSRKLSRLSACVQAANAVIYPMSWQHIFIPVLPASLLDYLSAPMPFVIGATTSVMQRTKLADIGDAVILDADNNRIDSPFNDLETLPQEVVSTLKRQLKNPNNMLGDGVARSFLRALVQLIGGYRDALRFPQDCAKITFDKDAFIQSRPAHIQPFLKEMLNLQIFHQFITERLEMLNSGQGFSDEFELEACLYSEKSSSRLTQQYKDWASNVRKEGGAFIKTVRSKTNPALKSAVKGVKETGKSGSKQVRSAYKNIKSRLKDIQQTPEGAPGGRLDEEPAETQPRSAPSSPGSARPRRGISRGSSAVTYRRQPTEPLTRVGGRAAAATQSAQTIKYHVIDPPAPGSTEENLFPPASGPSLLDEVNQVLERIEENKETDLIRLDSAEDELVFDPLRARDRASSLAGPAAVAPAPLPCPAPLLGLGPFNGVRPANGAVHNPVYPFCQPRLQTVGVPLVPGAGGYPLSGSRSAASVLSAAPAPAPAPAPVPAAPAPAPRRQPVRQPSQSSEELLKEYGLDFSRLAVNEPHRDPAAPQPPAPAPAPAPGGFPAPAKPPPPLPPKSTRWTTFE